MQRVGRPAGSLRPRGCIGLMRETEYSKRSVEAYVAMSISGFNQREARSDNWLMAIFVCFSVRVTAGGIGCHGTRRPSILRLSASGMHIIGYSIYSPHAPIANLWEFCCFLLNEAFN